MKDVPENELLSAYLDGELTADEQAEVQRLLVESPAAGQLLDDLRALSSTLQALPQQKLGEDLTEQVLRIAEREILTQPVQPSKSAPVARRPIFRRLLNPRALSWSTVAVAVAVLLTIIDRNQGDRRLGERHANERLAMAPEQPRPDTPAATVQATPETDEESGRPSTADADRDLAVGAPHEEVVDFDADDELAIAGSASGGRRKAGIGIAGNRRTPEKPIAKKPDLQKDLPQETFPGDAVPEEAFAKKLGLGRGGIGGGQVYEDGGAHLDLKQEKGGNGRYDLAKSAAGDVRTYLAEQIGPTAGQILVVHCDVSPQTVEKKALAQLLLANGIAEAEEVTRLSCRGRSYYRYHDVADKRAESNRAISRVRRELNHTQPENEFATHGIERLKEQARQDIDGTLEALASADNRDLVWVSATPDQVRATLNDLKERSNEFLTVRVDPAPDFEEQQQLGRFNRSAQLARLREGEPVVTQNERPLTRKSGSHEEQQFGANLQRPARTTMDVGDRIVGTLQRAVRGMIDVQAADAPAAPAIQPADSAPVQKGTQQDPFDSVGKTTTPKVEPPLPETPLVEKVAEPTVQPADESAEEPKSGGYGGGTNAKSASKAEALPGEEGGEHRTAPAATLPAITPPAITPPATTEKRPVALRGSQQQALSEPAPMYRVLFVLRVVEPHLPGIPSADVPITEVETTDPAASQAAPAAQQ